MIQQIDLVVFQWLNSWAFWGAWTDALIVFRAVFLGYWIVLGILAFGFLTIPPLSVVFPSFRILRRKNWEMAGVALMSALFARFGAVELVRMFYDRARPFEVLSDVNQLIFRDGGGSFPSGHAAFYFAIAAVVSRYYPKASVLFFLAALNLSAARVQAGIHWPSDILAGAMVGIITAWLAVFILRKLEPISKIPPPAI